MSLVPERPFDGAKHRLKGRRMCRNGKAPYQRNPFFRRQVELARCAIRDVGADDAGDLFTERLNSD